jgi:CRP-like cAMP-binding protein
MADCSRVTLTLREMMYDVGDAVRYVYFPTTSFISMLAVVGESVLEVAMIGDEGMCGYPIVLGGDASSLRALAQGSGDAWRIDAVALRTHMAEMPALRDLLYRYIGVVVEQLAQAAACKRFHLVEERLARLLLMTRDRVYANSFQVTQEVLASTLGIRRVGVTKAARSLQDHGMISYKRGAITIVDATSLGNAACICYKKDLAIYSQGMGKNSAKPRMGRAALGSRSPFATAQTSAT